MTELTITPKVADKTARFKGAVAAGEHVAVTIKGGAAWLGDDNGEHLSLRVLDLVTGRTLAVFPRPEETYGEDEEYVPDEWSTSAEDPNDLFCNLNFNTDRMVNAARHMLRVPVLFVMGTKDEANPATTRTLYFRDRHEVEFWPERVGDDTPYDLDKWPKQIDEWTDLIAEFETRIDAAEDSIRDAVDEANGIVAHVDAAKTDAQSSATAAGGSASAAQASAATAKNWATGGGETGDPGATNNAKYYAQQAGASAESAEGSATSAATAAANAEAWAVGKRNGVDVPSTDATYENNAKHYAAAAAASAQEAEETLENKADKATTLAGYGIADAYTKTETNDKISTAVSAEAQARDTAISTAISAVKDSAPEAFDTLKEIADWIGDDQSGAAAMAAQISSHTSQLSQLSQNKVDKVAGKGLSTNDYTTAEKQKLAGIADGANNYTLPPATAATLGGVKQGTGCTIEPDGTLNVTGGGGGTVDDSVTRTSANPVKSSGIWGAIWGALTDVPRAFTSLYDYCMGWFVDAESIAPSWDYGTFHVGDLRMESRKNGTSGRLYRCKKEYYTNSESDGPSHDTEHWEPVDVTTLIAGKQDTLSAQQLADIAAVPGKASAADLRYRIAETGFKYEFAASAFPITYMNTVASTAVTITAGDAGDITWDVQLDGSAYVFYNGFDFAYFSSAGDYGGSRPGVDLQFNGVAAADAGEPLVQTLADRTVNLVTAADETSIDIELPAAVTVDGVRRARDFILDIDNSANASDLALEFTALGVDYAFVPLEDDSISEMMTIGAGERVRLYFTETSYFVSGSSLPLPVIHVARVTLGDFVTSTTTQGGN